MVHVIQIDGAQGEGGGQIVRSSLALSMVTGIPFTIDNVRAGRERPGLMRQHLTAVQAAQRICNAEVVGDAIGSGRLAFHPGPVVPGDYHFAIGTAGSAPLVLQTVLPPLLLASAPSRLILEGGTHNPAAPSFDFIERVYLPLINRMGPRVKATLERHGFYPAGGGRFVVLIEPCVHPHQSTQVHGATSRVTLNPFDVLHRGEIRARRGRVLLCNLPGHIAERECEALKRLASWADAQPVQEVISANGPGNAVVIELECEHITEMFVSVGEYGVSAEAVVRRAVDELRAYLVADVPVGPHLADQLLLPQAIAIWLSNQASERLAASFHTTRLTDHSLTHIEIIKSFLGLDIRVSASDEQVKVSLGP